MSRFIIELNSVRFFAHHGLYAEEQLTGNEFEVDLWMECRAPEQVVSSLEETINYGEAFEVVKEEFGRPLPLLETLAMKIADSLQERFTLVEKITIRIRKLHPPIIGFTGSVAVTYSREVR
jgi:dihydroneopterin aldolase